jgi:hypothetical protein
MVSMQWLLSPIAVYAGVLMVVQSACAVAGLLKQPNELLAKFNLAINDQNIRHISWA